jgi:L-ribulose-5-phosphate 3-epimerase|tara:strand:- start:1680 stop:2510 length:831 start_codon:yes stop_codon:yes gene_type:complete
MNVGIMSGRLSKQIDNEIQVFPFKEWQKEFEKAKDCGFSSIEWIFDLKPNPISNEKGINEMNDLMKKSKVMINSVCCDYFMKRQLFGHNTSEIEQNYNILKKIIEASKKLGIKNIEIPFVDSSSLKNEEDKKQIIEILQKTIPLLDSDMKIVLETDLEPKKFREFLESFQNNKIKANYDTGNSAALGYNMKEEFREIGMYFGNIHIKDRKFQGDTVPLGCGDVNFGLFFDELSKIDYKGELIIQGARQDFKENQIITCKSYLKIVKQYLDKYNNGV